MDRGNVLSGAGFSAVLLSAGAFLVALIAVGFLTHREIERSLEDAFHDEVQTRFGLLTADYRQGGADDLTALIKSATLFNAKGQRAIGLFGADGTPIVGNILRRPEAAGWQKGPLDLSDAPAPTGAGRRDPDYFFRSGNLDGLTLVVGQRMDLLLLTSHAMLRTLAIAGFIVVLTMLAAGYFFSRKAQGKLEELEKTLALVSAGDIAARMAVSPENDQIDRIALRMNAHLDALSRLMVTTRTTIAAVAHDLKSPLSRAYLGLGRALDRVEAGQDPRGQIEDTQAELERMNGVFDSFLHLSRIESGTDGTRFAEVDLDPLLADLAETYQMVAEDSGQTLSYARPDGEKCIITGDAGMVQQMVANLLQNAVTHGGAGNDIRLGLGRVAGKVGLTVSDTGPGIPEAVRDTVFEPFHRLDPSRNKPGSGLGLALVRAIAERHSAHVSLSDNAPGLRVVVTFDSALGNVMNPV